MERLFPMASTLMSSVSPSELPRASSVPQEANSNETVRIMLIFRFITTDLLSIVCKFNNLFKSHKTHIFLLKLYKFFTNFVKIIF